MDQTELLRRAFQYQEALTAYAYGLLRDWTFAEDAVQEAFVVLMEKHAEYNPDLGVYPWVRRMVQLKVLELLRRTRRETPCAEEELLQLAQRSLTEHFQESTAESHRRKQAALDLCLGGLSTDLRRLLSDYYVRNLPGSRLAQERRRSVNAIWLTLSRARKALRECVERKLAEA
jgi:RNA polymerase sigma-70 factor (ECF subfamily)